MKRLVDRKNKSKKFLDKIPPKLRHLPPKRFLFIGCSVLLLFFVLATYLSGFSSMLVNLRPPIEVGQKDTELFCNYRGSRLSATVTTHSNINNYYKNSRSKGNYLNNSQLEKFTYTNSADDTIRKLADDIRTIGKSKGLSDDQLVEVASCFVQNIPYDTPKSEVVLGSGEIADKDLAQFPYETLFKNSGICTDKTYLGSALIRELGYGTGILLFPDAQHMALGVKAPSGYTDFETKYSYIETTTPDFVIGEVPADVSEINGTPAVSINSVSELSIEQDPSSINSFTKQSIASPNMVIDVNDGKEYLRIVAIVNLENTIIQKYEALLSTESQLNSAYEELMSRESHMDSKYSTYLSTPDTKLDCGLKYDYSYSYSYSYGYYSSPYTYRCDTVSNFDKTLASISYNSARSSYNNQVDFYNGILDKYNSIVNELDKEITRYKTYDYN